MSAMGLLTLLVVGQTASPGLADRLHLHGWVDTYATVDPHPGEGHANFFPGAGSAGKRANELALNAAALSVTLDPAPVGATLIVGTGNSFDVIHAGEPIGAATSPALWRFLQQASIEVKPAQRLLLEAGVMPSYIGFESFVTKDDWNYTRSWVAELSPFYETGIRAHYDFTDHCSAELHAMNGWQLIGDNNFGKSFGAQLKWQTAGGSLTFNTFAGPEIPDDNDHWRLFGDLVGTLNLPHGAELALVVDGGLQQRPGLDDAHWWGAALSGRLSFAKHLAVSARGGAYWDPDAVTSGASQTLTEATLTFEAKPWEPLLLKAEGRFDHSTAAVFDKGRDTQWLGLLSAVAAF